MSGDVVVGVVIGGTKVVAGVVDGLGAVSSTARRTTPGRRVLAHQVEDALVEAALESAAGRPSAGCRRSGQRGSSTPAGRG